MKRLLLVCFFAFVGFAPKAQAMPTIDISNLIQNIYQVINQGREYAQMIEDYRAKVEHYQEIRENLKNLSPDQMRALLLQAGGARDNRLGQSVLGFAQYMDPNGAWQPQIEALLRSYYTLPTTTDFRDLLAQAGRNDPRMARWYDFEDAKRRPLYDATHFVAAQEDAAGARGEAVERIKREFKAFGKNSELRQMQAANAFSALNIEQQEALIDAIHMLVQQQSTSTYAQMDAMNRQHIAVLQRIAHDRADSAVRCNGNCLPAW